MNEKEYNELVNQLNSANTAYYVRCDPIMPDAEFDKKLQALTDYEKANPDKKSTVSPSLRVGSDLVVGFKKSQHVVPCLSIDNVFSPAELETKLESVISHLGHPKDVTWSLEPKVDGLSLDLEYENGTLVRALTRGNGLVGDDVTENVRTIRSVPLALAATGCPLPRTLHIRGEVFMSFKVYLALNAAKAKAGEPLLANPRNAAAGALKLLDSAEVARRKLDFVPYHVVDPTVNGPELVSQHQLRDWLFQLGFRRLETPEPGRYYAIEALVEAVLKFEATKRHLPYPTDGAVIKLNDLRQRQEFPDGSKSVRWAWAYKYAPDQVETTLKSVTFQVGRLGQIAPVAELEPVEVAGSTVSRASLHNLDYINKLGLMLNDRVVVAKAGEIIPQVVSVLIADRGTDVKPITWPTACPECHTKLVKAKTEEGEGAAWLCPNEECPARIRGRIEQWCGKDAMDIQDLGPVLIDKLVKASMVERVEQLYALDMGQLITLPRVGETLAQKVLDEIEQSRGRGLERVLVGLGIPRLGAGSAKRLARRFKCLADILNASDAELASVPDFGPVNIRELRAWANKSNNKATVLRLQVAVDTTSNTYQPAGAAGPLAGKIFVFTGTLSMQRPVAEKMVEDRGGRASGSVSKKTTYVVAGEEAGSKLTKANELKVTVLDEEQFMKMMEENT